MSKPGEPKRVIVVTGISGAGRSEVGHALEDLGYFVIDNLPASLLGAVRQLTESGSMYSKLGLVVDVRAGEFEAELTNTIEDLIKSGLEVQVIFVDAADDVLIRRFDSTRRAHPLGGVETGIAKERVRLRRLKESADLVFDTTEMTAQDLRNRVRNTFSDSDNPTAMKITLESFGFKHGIPMDLDTVFDCRFLPNPHWDPALRPKTGRDPEVLGFLEAKAEYGEFIDRLRYLFEMLLPAYDAEGKAYLNIGFGCTGGKHRSVAIAEALGKTFEKMGYAPIVIHRDIDRE